MKSTGSTVAQETTKAVQGQFSHLYKVMGDSGRSSSRDALALMQKGSKNHQQQQQPHKKK